jgi:hypothetical protein
MHHYDDRAVPCHGCAAQVLSGLVSSIYKATSSFQEVDPSLPPLWKGKVNT